MSAVDLQHRPGAARRGGGSSHDRFACLDGLRAIAALAIVIHHVAFNTGADTSTVAGYVFNHLDVGVSVFFVLSGFLLYRPYVAAHLRGTPPPSLRRYLKRRFLRIFPPYWAALTAFVFVFSTIHLHGATDVIAYYGLVHIYWQSRALGGIVATWSLAVEVSFYAFLPVYATLLRRWAGAGRRTVRAEALGVGVLYVGGLSIHALLLATHPHPTVATLWLPSQIDLFALGMGLAVVSGWTADTRNPPRLVALAGRHPGLCWAAAAGTFMVAVTALGLPRTFGALPRRGEMGRQFFYGLTGAFLVLPAVIGAQAGGTIRRLLRSRPATAAGLISYGIFLWHMDLMTRLLGWGAAEWASQARFLSVLALTIVFTVPFAAVSYLAIERPLGIERSRSAAVAK